MLKQCSRPFSPDRASDLRSFEKNLQLTASFIADIYFAETLASLNSHKENVFVLETLNREGWIN